MEFFLYVPCTLALLVLSVADLKTYEIPMKCNFLIGMLGMVRLFLDLTHWHQYAAGFFAASGLLFAAYLLTGGKAVGGGDVKLMAAAGLFLGWENILLALGIGSLAALGIQTVLLTCKKQGHVFAFGPYLSMGIFCAMLWGEEIRQAGFFFMQVHT